jgi:hypothetical protein
MYLLVFVTIVISLLGIYTQALTIQMARAASMQTSVADVMYQYHMQAVELARYTLDLHPTTGAAPGPTGCLLSSTVNYAANPPVNCMALIFGGTLDYPLTMYNTPILQALGLLDCSQTTPRNSRPCIVPLGPPTLPLESINNELYTFSVVFYQPPGVPQGYILTFIPPPVISAANPAPGFIQLTYNPTPLGVRMGDLMQQLKKSGLPPMNYGIAMTINGNHYLVSHSISNGSVLSDLQYPLPANGCCTVPDGSIGIISSP